MTNEELSQSLGRALGDVYARTSRSDFDDLIESYEEVRSSFLPQLAGGEALEAQRRIAELILYSAIEKNVPHARCRGLLEDLERLGYTDLEKKSNVQIIYARHCLARGQNDEGIRLLEGLRSELEAQLGREEHPLYRELLNTTAGVLRQLRSAKP